MSAKEYTTIRVSFNLWKRINREREPTENFDEVISRMMNERDRSKVYSKGVIKDIT
jgi:hypothetical protein